MRILHKSILCAGAIAGFLSIVAVRKAPGAVVHCTLSNHRSNRMRRHAVRAFWAWLLTAAAFGAAAQPRDAVVIGVSTPLTGLEAGYGQGLVHGLRLGLAASAEGERVSLTILDDGGDAKRAEANTQQLLRQGVVALTAYRGTRSVEAALPLAEAAGVPMVGAASSADSLRDPRHSYLFNLRAGAADEMVAIVQHYDTFGIQRFAALAQDDALGAAGLQGLRHELSRIAIRPEALVTLGSAITDEAVAEGLVRLCSTAPEAVLLALDAKWVLPGVRAARRSGCARSSFAVLSETGVALIGDPDAAGLVVTQVLPHPMRLSHALVAAYHRALGGEPQRASYASLEGFLYGRVLAEALRLCGKRATAACVHEALSIRTPKVPGWRLVFTPQDRRGARFIEITMLDRAGRPLR